jgi:nitrite reductase/ring-hydroxylating ferredoxin subunit
MTARERMPIEHAVGPASKLPPGERSFVRVRNLEIAVYNVDGKYYALQNMCPHQFGPACLGKVGGQTICNADTDWHMQWARDGEILTCPWHGMQFDLTTGASLTSATARLRTFPVEVVDGEVRVLVGGRRDQR